MEAIEITQALKEVILQAYGDRVGTFKLQSVDEDTSRARQKARSQLTKEQRLLIDRALVPFRDWLIERDPEAAERVAKGVPAPQDIETAVRAAEDHAVAHMALDLTAEEQALLTYRLQNGRVETIEERNQRRRRPLKLSNRHVRTMAGGVAVIFLGSGLAGVATEAATIVTVVGAAIFVFGFRRWRSGEVTSNIPQVSVFRGGKISDEGREQF
ncbi:uncharacterized protein METZ01_LOCUS18828 [marine metagenome]|uniref:Uncharacterized protein n=1 Tax=marine metagenome TaxID=408172 RepID=A0A381PH51_9ZZZZ